MKVMFNGKERFAVRSLNYPSPPGIGTVLGPTEIGEYMTVVAVEGNKAHLAFTTEDDMAALPQEPRSIAEYTLLRRKRGQ